MFKTVFEAENTQNESEPKEGELYKSVTTFGKTFELRYGFYEEQDRHNPLCRPAVIYPDFIKEPIYTDDGEPFVTVTQDACTHYSGEFRRTPDTTCEDCKYFRQGKEWFGICICRERQNNGQ